MKRAHLSAPALAAAALLASRSASAQSHVYQGNWRQADRHEAATDNASSQSFLLEVRFAPYWPQVDQEFTGPGQGPYEKVFGNAPQFYFGLEFDWQALRIPHVGVLGPGIGWGYTTRSAPALIAAGPLRGQPSGESTDLTIMPMHLSAVFRLDGPLRDSGFPLVPYVKVGVGAGVWSSGTTLGISHYTTADGTDVVGRGLSWGEHLALGGMLCLNWLDTAAAAKLDEGAGINHAYLFGEWMDASLNGLGSKPQMRVGTSTVVLGFALDM